MADIFELSNSVAGITYEEEVFPFVFAGENSAHGASATLRSVIGPMNRPGRILSLDLGVVAPAVSASGFVSGTVDADVRINSAGVCSTLPAIAMAGSAGQAVRVATNGPANAASGLVTAGVVNTASANFSAGDMISVNYNARSVGSAAAGAAGTGLYVGIRVRYTAL